MQLHLATSPRVTGPDGATVPLAPRDAALLAWLALEGPTARTRLAGLLWPDSDAEAARNALRQRLFQLRRLLGQTLVSGNATLALAPGVLHDLADADSVLAGAADEFRGELAQWLEQQGERRRARLRDALAELSAGAEASRDYADALSHAQELLALDPLSEDAHRRVMRLHYLAGERAAALLAFDRCERLLKDEVGTHPGAETLALLATIEQAVPAAGPVVASRVPASVLRPPPPDRPRARAAGPARSLGSWPQRRAQRRCRHGQDSAGVGLRRRARACARRQRAAR
ncbi:MAG: hypothetical protein IPP50_18680 [Piscinibacter sp.]|nr:hypothetical protein [Piscinibacter sp.]